MMALAAVVALLNLATPAQGAAPGANLERGRALFERTTLGTNGKSCATCHAGGKRFEEVRETDDASLAAYVNSCIEGMLAGRPLPSGSEDLRALVLYVRSLAPRGK